MNWLFAYIAIALLWAWAITSATNKQLREMDLVITRPKSKIIATLIPLLAGVIWPISMPIILLTNLVKIF